VGAPQGVSLASTTCVTTAGNSDIGEKIVHSITSNPPVTIQGTTRNRDGNRPATSSSTVVNDKYFFLCNYDLNFYTFLEQVNFLDDNCQLVEKFKGVKGRLASHIHYWENIKANSFVIDTLKNGYMIPFLQSPPRMFHKNNRSALHNNDFVSEAVSDLVQSGCVIQVPFQPFVVNPLSVATQKSGKKRLILDLSILNNFVKCDKIKFEDWKIAIQYFEKNIFMFKFDLRSGYLHLDICPQHQTYLGFEWDGQFYCYTVLPFGLTTGPYIFTKCLRPLVKFWRENGIKVVLYLDDGFGMSQNREICIEDSLFVKNSLIEAGFLVNEEKSIFDPVTSLEWLGINWNSKDFSLSIPQRRINDLFTSLHSVFDKFPCFTARFLAQVVGRVISMTPVIGNVARIMTKYCYMAIESRKSWDSIMSLSNPHEVFSELKFWLDSINGINCRKMGTYSKSSVMIYSDASSLAAGAFSVEVESKIFHKMWTLEESVQSSTWRELKSIELALISYKTSFSGKVIKWFTDNQNCVKIVNTGSMKEDLHIIARSIFSICLNLGISIDIQWVPRTENEKADYISKMIDFEDWGVTNNFFSFIDKMWGPHSVDRFASNLNNKLPRFNSVFWLPYSEAVDAFSQDWSVEINWLVPPINLVIRTIKHLIACNARGTLVVPKWTSAAFWPLLFDKDLRYRSYVMDVIEFRDAHGIYKHGANKNSIFGIEPFGTPVLAVLLDAKY